LDWIVPDETIETALCSKIKKQGVVKLSFFVYLSRSELPPKSGKLHAG